MSKDPKTRYFFIPLSHLFQTCLSTSLKTVEVPEVTASTGLTGGKGKCFCLTACVGRSSAKEEQPSYIPWDIRNETEQKAVSVL